MNGEPSKTAGMKAKGDVHEVTAAMVYDALSELRGQAHNIFELAIQTNEKLVNNPVDCPDVKSKAEVDRPVNPRHFPGYRDIVRDISHVLISVQKLQEYLLNHI